MPTPCTRALTMALVLAAGRAGYVPLRAPRGANPSAPADPPAGSSRVNPKDGSLLVFVPAGAFTMGSSSRRADQRPLHTVYLDAFWIGREPVTVGRYRAFCRATGRSMPATPQWGWDERSAITDVTWSDANAYCRWAGLALRTEAQWEKAARGTDGRVYPWGSRPLSAKSALIIDPPHADPDDVGGPPRPSESPYRCLDMVGIVWQWCADRYDPGYYSRSPARNPSGPGTGVSRSIRGATRELGQEAYCHAAYRDSHSPSGCSPGIGFRVASPPAAP